MRTSIIVAGVLAVGATTWILSKQVGSENREVAPNQEASGEATAVRPVAVRVMPVISRTHQGAIIVNGRTEESRRVTIRAETSGPVSAVPRKEGDIVKIGNTLVRQNVEDRKARLAEMVALVRQREIEFRAAKKLATKGFRSGTKLAEARALLDSAKARAASIRVDLSRTNVRAPFTGILENRYVEIGDFVQIGDNIAKIVDLDPLLAVGFVSERNIRALEVGAPGKVTLVDGRTANGVVRFIAAVADNETRSFRVELEISNPGHEIRAGLTGELTLPLSPIRAHIVSPAMLTLADDGRIGVRIVDHDDIVQFVPIKILSDSNDGLWVSGLTDGQRLIIVGHEYVKSGQKVRPMPETASAGT